MLVVTTSSLAPQSAATTSPSISMVVMPKFSVTLPYKRITLPTVMSVSPSTIIASDVVASPSLSAFSSWIKKPPCRVPVIMASTIWLFPASSVLEPEPCIALMSVASSPQTPSATGGSTGGTSTSPPPSVVKVPRGNGVDASALVLAPSRASTPLYAQFSSSKVPAFAVCPLLR